jgi:predicted HTH transcriptional regulator
MFLVELYKIIEDGENSSVEFKRKFSSPEKIAKEMIAFANSKGGKILFGVDDDKTIIGVESEKGELESIKTAAKFYCEPEVESDTEILSLKKSDIVVINIPESKTKPHYLISIMTKKNSAYISGIMIKAY